MAGPAFSTFRVDRYVSARAGLLLRHCESAEDYTGRPPEVRLETTSDLAAPRAIAEALRPLQAGT